MKAQTNPFRKKGIKALWESIESIPTNENIHNLDRFSTRKFNIINRLQIMLFREQLHKVLTNNDLDYSVNRYKSLDFRYLC